MESEVVPLVTTPKIKNKRAPRYDYFLALDLEGLGDLLTAKLLAIGLVFGDSTGNIILKKRYTLKATRSDIEDKCWSEFWSKHPDVLDELLATGNPPELELQRLVDDLCGLDTVYGR